MSGVPTTQRLTRLLTTGQIELQNFGISLFVGSRSFGYGWYLIQFIRFVITVVIYYNRINRHCRGVLYSLRSDYFLGFRCCFCRQG